MNSYRTYLLSGAPGSGKGTQGKTLGHLPGFFHCACGARNSESATWWWCAMANVRPATSQATRRISTGDRIWRGLTFV